MLNQILGHNVKSLGLEILNQTSQILAESGHPHLGLIKEQVRRLNLVVFYPRLALSSQHFFNEARQNTSPDSPHSHKLLTEEKHRLIEALSSTLQTRKALRYARSAIVEKYPNKSFPRLFLSAQISTRLFSEPKPRVLTSTKIRIVETQLLKAVANLLNFEEDKLEHGYMKFLNNLKNLLIEVLSSNNPLFKNLPEPEMLVLPILDAVSALNSLQNGLTPAWQTAYGQLVDFAFGFLTKSNSFNNERFSDFLETLSYRHKFQELPEVIKKNLKFKIEEECVKRISKSKADPRLGSCRLAGAALKFFDLQNRIPLRLLNSLEILLCEIDSASKRSKQIKDPIAALTFFSILALHQIPKEKGDTRYESLFSRVLNPIYLHKSLSLLRKNKALSFEEILKVKYSLRGLSCAVYAANAKYASAFKLFASNLQSYLRANYKADTKVGAHMGQRLGQLCSLAEVPGWQSLVSKDLLKLITPNHLFELSVGVNLKQPDQVLSNVLKSYFTSKRSQAVLIPKSGSFAGSKDIQTIRLYSYAGINLFGYEFDFLLVAEVTKQNGNVDKYFNIFELDGASFHLRNLGDGVTFQRIADLARDKFLDNCGLSSIRLNSKHLRQLESATSVDYLSNLVNSLNREKPNILFLQDLIRYYASGNT